MPEPIPNGYFCVDRRALWRYVPLRMRTKLPEHYADLLLQIWTLPKLTLIFSSTAVATLESVLVDSGDPPALSLPTEPPRKPQELDIEQVIIAPLGESCPKPHLLVCTVASRDVLLQSNQILLGVLALWAICNLRNCVLHTAT